MGFVSWAAKAANGIIVVAAILAVINLMDGAFFVKREDKRRFNVDMLIAACVLIVSFAVIVTVSYPLSLAIGDSLADEAFWGAHSGEVILSFVVMVLAFAYAVYSFVRVVLILKAGPDKNDKGRFGYLLLLLATSVLAVVFQIFWMLRQYDLVHFYDQLVPNGGLYTFITTVPGVFSNNLFLGFALVMAIIASIGMVGLMLVYIFKEDKSKFFAMLSLVVMAVYLALPVFSMRVLLGAPSDGAAVDGYPGNTAISGFDFIMGFDGASFQPVLFIAIVALAAEFVLGFVSKWTNKNELVYKRINAGLSAIAGFVILFTTSMPLSEGIQAQIAQLIAYGGDWALKYVYGFSSVTGLFGALVMIFAAGSVWRDAFAFIKRFNFLSMAIAAFVATLFFTFLPVYSLSGDILTLTGLSLLIGVEGKAGMNVVGVLLYLLILGGIGLVSASEFVGEKSKSFRLIGAGATVLAAILMFAVSLYATLGMTGEFATIQAFYALSNRSATVGTVVPVIGILLLIAAAGYVYPEIVEIIKKLKAKSNGRVSAFFVRYSGVFGAGLALVLLAITMLLTTAYSSKLGGRVTFFEIMLGKGKMTANIFAILFVALTVAAIVLSVLANFGKLKKVWAYVAAGLFVLAAVMLFMTDGMSAVFVSGGLKKYSLSFALMGILMIVAAYVSIFKSSLIATKAAGKFLVENGGITVTIVCLVTIILYIEGVII